ncbi:acetyl-CoA carboxylase carboxyltransferase subunit beta [Lacticaseibacillus pabuli]|uniref:Acetyl-coenzyme A carboxylase carboxyl transferase subunit beta n=1 Tax=Lacticaseibacillus pabuli TaxID=3025672 RepID=A0ABY7WUJ0_9LACO|nr:acetyl-CoA carboxylase carboxyltransferase subunit beta [Lacticaseibacillus sp. KACC 23028]WDF83838.1 acetyl-CoA carboxylase carboxyltransferase subunit beta [Lacticaseibacillus sp. KACC 23028]
MARLSLTGLRREAALPGNLWARCGYCGHIHYRNKFGAASVCPDCGYGLRIGAAKRISMLTDTFIPWFADLDLKAEPTFPGYAEKRRRAQTTSGQVESVTVGLATIQGQQCGLGVMSTDFMMGSLGAVAGEKLTRLFERALELRLPVVVLCASGGARMQEGIVSLMQMAKVSAAVAAHDAAGLLYISVITDPTMGGVTASFAMQGDIILAETHAMIGFTGRRVIESTIKQKLPGDFQRAETVQEQGFIDKVVGREELAGTLGQLLRLHGGESHD